MMGNSRASAAALLEEGLRLEKGGLLDRAIEQYRTARELSSDAALMSESWRLESYAHHARSAWPEALAAARRSVELARSVGQPELLAEALNAEAAVHYGRGAFDEALRLYASMLGLAAGPKIRGLALQNMGIIHGRRGEVEQAQRRLEQASREFEEAGYDWGRAHVLNNRVAVALDREDWVTAESQAREAVALARRIDDLDLISVATVNLAEALMGLGRLEEAERAASQALGQFRTSGNRWRQVSCFRLLGDLAWAESEADLAGRMWQSGLELAETIGARVEAEHLKERLGRESPPAARRGEGERGERGERGGGEA